MLTGPCTEEREEVLMVHRDKAKKRRTAKEVSPENRDSLGSQQDTAETEASEWSGTPSLASSPEAECSRVPVCLLDKQAHRHQFCPVSSFLPFFRLFMQHNQSRIAYPLKPK